MNELENNTTPNNQQNISNVSTDMNNNQNSYQASPTQEKKKGSSKVGVLIAILLILVLALIGVIATKFIFENQNSVKALVTNAFEYLEGNIKDYSKVSGTFDLKVNGNSTDNDANEIFAMLNKIDLEGTYGVDLDNKIISLDLKSNYDKEKLLNLNLYAENGIGYVYLEDIYDKYIKTDIENYNDVFKKTNKEDYKVILKSMNKAITKSLKDDYFETSKETVDGKKLTKTKLNLNTENQETLKNDILKSLLEDSEFLKSTATITEKTEDEIKENIQNEIDTKVEGSGATLTLYTEGNKFVKLELKQESGTIEITKESDGIYNYSITSNNETYSGTIKVTKQNENTTVSFSVKDSTNMSYEVTVTTSTQYNKEISKKSIDKSIDYKDLTDEDTSKIYSNILKSKGITNLLTDISKMTTSSATDTSNDYDSYFDDDNYFDDDEDYFDDYEF